MDATKNTNIVLHTPKLTRQYVDGRQLKRIAPPRHRPDLPEALNRPKLFVLGDQEAAGLEEERIHARVPHALLDERGVGRGTSGLRGCKKGAQGSSLRLRPCAWW